MEKESNQSERDFMSQIKSDNKALRARVENLELQIKFYNYSTQLSEILEAMKPEQPEATNDEDSGDINGADMDVAKELDAK